MFEAQPQNCLLNLGTADLSALLYAGHEAAIHIEIVATCAKRVANLRVSRRLSPEGGGGGGVMGSPCPPPPPRSAPAMNHCFMSCKHKTLESASPLDSSVAVSHIQRLIPKGKWFPPCDESPELHSSCQTFCVVMVVSDGLRSTLTSSKFI